MRCCRSIGSQCGEYLATVVSFAAIALCLMLDYENLVFLGNAMGGLQKIIFVFAFLRLRHVMWDWPRPIKFMGDVHAVIPTIVIMLPLAFYVCTFVNAFEHGLVPIAFILLFVAIGALIGWRTDLSNVLLELPSRPRVK